MVARREPVVVDAEVVAPGELMATTRCQHVSSKGVACTHQARGDFPFCMGHLKSASIAEIRLVRGENVTFGEITGRRVSNPLEELALLVSEVLLYKDYTAQRVAELRGQERYEGKAGEQLRAEVALYERSLDRAGKLLVEWSRLNIDERLARIEEQKAQQILDVIRSSLGHVELTDEARKTIERHIISGLRGITA